MWRCKLLLLFFILPLLSFAQQPQDSLFFVKYAGSFPDIFPQPYNVPFTAIRDTFEHHRNIPPGNRQLILTHYRVDEDGTKKDSAFLSDGYYHYDKQGRLVAFEILLAGEQRPGLRFSARYLTGNKPVSFILEREGKVTSHDTAKYVYNKSGEVAAITWHHIDEKTDTVYRQQWLYDGLHRVVVIENASYGTVSGTYTFAYNKDGDPVQRNFSVRENGAVLATDTFIYSSTDSAKQLLSVVHKLRFAGHPDWILVEELQAYRADGRVVYYVSPFLAGKKFGITEAGQELKVDYTLDNQKALETFTTKDQSRVKLVTYFYDPQEQHDSVNYFIRDNTAKHPQTLRYAYTVKTYARPSKVLLEKKTVTLPANTRKKKKAKTSADAWIYSWS